MATYSSVHINLPEAEVLADLTGIHDDLSQARLYARQLQGAWSSSPPDVWLVEPFSTAILVRYARPFATGVRLRLGADALAVLTEDQRRRHADFIAFRDKHIAHSVNAYEANQPIAVFCVERVDVEGITAIECNHTRVVGLSAEDLGHIIALIDALLTYVDRRIENEKAKILPLVRATPIANVLKGPAVPGGIVAGNPGRARERPRP